MGEDCGSWFPPQQFNHQLPNLDQFGAPLFLGQQSNFPSYMKVSSDTFSTNGALPVCPFHELTCSRIDQVNEPSGWFYCLSRFRQAFVPALNPVVREKLHTVLDVNCKDASIPRDKSGSDQKRFLVFDQSGNQTKLIFSSGFGTTNVQRFTSLNPKQNVPDALIREDNVAKEEPNLGTRTISLDVGGDVGTDLQSEMHEDTEELNALLYSDDDSDYTVDDEVTSTGHSPSTTRSWDKPMLLKRINEEVASSDGSTRKRKLFDTEYIIGQSLTDTASSLKPVTGFDCEDDAESRCEFGMNKESAEMGLRSSFNRMKKIKIYETLSTLENIIPGVKGKNMMTIIDEAILYLKSLKVKAKALGLDTP